MNYFYNLILINITIFFFKYSFVTSGNEHPNIKYIILNLKYTTYGHMQSHNRRATRIHNSVGLHLSHQSKYIQSNLRDLTLKRKTKILCLKPFVILWSPWTYHPIGSMYHPQQNKYILIPYTYLVFILS